MNTSTLFLLLAAYIVGSMPFGLLAGKLKGVDIRDHGSGNIGATNVFRICGKGFGIAVLLLDMLKGLGPVILAQHFSSETDSLTPIAAGVAAILGHNFPVWLKFKGGKGIATSAGVFAGLLPWALLVAAVIWLIIFAVTRYVSLASIIAALSLPVTMAILTFGQGGGRSRVDFYFALVVGLLAVWRHRINIQRLRQGTEHRFTSKPKASS